MIVLCGTNYQPFFVFGELALIWWEQTCNGAQEDEGRGGVMQRQSRRQRGNRAKADAALEEYREATSLGLKRAELYEGESSGGEGASVDEEDMRRLRAAERAEGDFVVDDDGTGYKDYGNDDEQEDVHVSGNIGSLKRSLMGPGAAPEGRGKRAKQKEELDAKRAEGSRKLTSMFAGAISRPNFVAEVRSGAVLRREKQAEEELANDRDLGMELDNLMLEEQRYASHKKRKKKKTRKEKGASSSKRRSSSKKRPVRRDIDDLDAMGVDVPLHDAMDMDDHDNDVMGEADDGPRDVPATHDDSTDEQDEDKPKTKSCLLAAAQTQAFRAPPKRKPPSPIREETVPTTTPTTIDGKAMNLEDENDDSGWLSGATQRFDIEEDESSSTPVDEEPASITGKGLENENGESYIDVFWLDMYEDYFTMKGKVHIFGKMMCPRTKKMVSCYVEVQTVNRVLFVLPRKRLEAGGWKTVEGNDDMEDENEGDADDEPRAVEFSDVLEEMQGIISKILPMGRDSERAFRCKKTPLKYAFELRDVPREETDYLEVQYPMCAEKDRLTYNLQGKTFSRIFGTHQSAIEQLLLSRDLMGPCWIRIKGIKAPEMQTHSWCTYNYVVETPKALTSLKTVLLEKAKAQTADNGVAKAIEVPSPPKMKVLSLTMKTMVDPQSHEHQIMMISGIVRDEVDVVSATPGFDNPRKTKAFTLIRGQNNGGIFPPGFKDFAKSKAPQVKVQSNERSLLSSLMANFIKLDPDIVVGHNIRNFEMDVLITRLKKHSLGLSWSKVGRLKQGRMPNKKTDGGFFSTANLIPGRLLLDTLSTARELLLGQRSYSLKELCRSQLGKDRFETLPVQVPQFYSTKEWLLKLVQRNEIDAWLTLQLAFKLEAVPLTMQLTNLGGNLWSRTLSGGRAERIEYLLLHEFFRKKYVLPDKLYAKDKKKANSKKDKNKKVEDYREKEVQSRSRARKPKYDGGLVLEPKKGLYDKYILLLDFNSLYPSIIQEYNICYTTVERAHLLDSSGDVQAQTRAENMVLDEDDEGDGANNALNVEPDDSLPDLPDRAKYPELAILPSLIKELVDRRKIVKRELKQERDPAKRKQLDVRQKALKLTANSMYGCLGFNGFRFFAKPVAALVTAQGRAILQNTVDITQNKLGYSVVYGDTDSIMINTNATDMEEVKRIGNRVKEEINKLYQLLEIEQDGVFKTMLLLKKKKYAALAITEVTDAKGNLCLKEEKETKGLDLVRRDWCELSKDVGHKVLDFILSGKTYEEIVEGIHECLDEVHELIKANKIPLEKFVITKGLNKHPKDYPDAKSQPHLQVALEMMRRNKPVSVGDHIPYVICTLTRAEYEKKLEQAKNGQDAMEEDEKNEKNKEQTKGKGTGSYAERAFHPEEVKASTNDILQVDINWYLKMQIVPPTQRLCEPIEGTSPQQIAEHLGLDPKLFQNSSHGGSGGGEDADLLNVVDISDEERFKNCENVELGCAACGFSFDFPGVVLVPDDLAKIVPEREIQSHEAKSGLRCPSCEMSIDASYLSNVLQMAARKAVSKYYEGWLIADDPSADLRTRQQSVLGKSFVLNGRRVQLVPEYGPDLLFTQLRYLESLVDLDRRCENITKANIRRKEGNKITRPSFTIAEEETCKNLLKNLRNDFLDHSAYNWVQPSLFKAAFHLQDET